MTQPPVAKRLAVMANSPADYERLGLSPTSIEVWEDGARTDDSAGTYEWWYFDAHLADGAKLVIAFMNKDIAEPQKPLSPLLRLELDLPDGRHFEKIITFRRRSGRRQATMLTCGLATIDSPVICTPIGSRRLRRRYRSMSR